MIKYYLGYYEVNGLWWPLTWEEVEGTPVGVRPSCSKADTYELTEMESCLTLQELVRKYPKQGVTLGSLSVGTFPT